MVILKVIPSDHLGQLAGTHVAALVLALLATAGAAAGEAPAGLAPLRQVSSTVEIAHPLPSVTTADLAAHLLAALRRADPALTIQEGRPDRIRVTVSVRPMSATTLRGFWLPFSGTYGIGTIRLAVERLVTLPGLAQPVPATLWQLERAVGGPWQRTDAEILSLLDEMVAKLAEARAGIVKP